MQIVIDINDEIYKEILSGKDGWSNYIHGLIRTGKPLPKGHGRLLDEKDILDIKNNDGSWVYDLVDVPEYIVGVKAIIEEDKEKKQ